MMARTVSMATRIKISRSLKGNKNAYSGGPKARLTARQKVANINAATAKKRKVLSQAQLENRKKAAMRLRRQARAEEAGIKPNAPNTKPLPTAKSIKNDPDIKEAAARAKGKLPQTKNHRLLGPPNFREQQDELAERFLDMHGDNGLNRKIQQLEKRTRLTLKEQGELGALQRLSDSRRAPQREDGVPAKVTRVSEPKKVSKTMSQYRAESRAYDAERSAARAKSGANGKIVFAETPVSSKSTKSAQARGRKVQ